MKCTYLPLDMIKLVESYFKIQKFYFIYKDIYELDYVTGKFYVVGFLPYYLTNLSVYALDNDHLVIMGHDKDQRCVLGTMDLLQNKWSPITVSAFSPCHVHLFIDRQYTYVMEGGGYYNDCLRYHYLLKHIQCLASPSIIRMLGATVHVHHYIYLFGGFCQDTRQWTNIVECYNIQKNEWTKCASMPRICSDHTAVLWLRNHRFIFLFGGYNGYSTDIFMYDIEKNVWINMDWKLPYRSGKCHVVQSFDAPHFLVACDPIWLGTITNIKNNYPIAVEWQIAPFHVPINKNAVSVDLSF